ncbi:MAG: hypothetical protein WCF36_17890 [Candidatus Nanopelagicales bacterium]
MSTTRDTATAARPGRDLAPSSLARGLSVALAAATIAAAAPTLLMSDLLNGPAVMNGSARGTALVMLVLGVPLLITSMLGTRRGITWALPLWIGAIAYLLYNGFMLLFATPFNSLFLLYVATFSLALWALIAVLHAVDVPGLVDQITPGLPRRSIAVFTATIVALNTALWLRAIIPGLFESASPAFLEGTGLTTIPTYIQDLAVWLPLAAVASYWLWHGLAWGVLAVSGFLAMWVLESITVAVDQLMGSAADPTSTVASSAVTPVFAVLALATLVPLVALLRHLGPNENPR